MKEKILKPRASKVLTTFIIVAIFLLLVLYFSFGSRLDYFDKTEEEIRNNLILDSIILAIWILLCGVFIFVLLKMNSYVITKSEIIHKRFNKELHYPYQNIIYIDEDYTLKHKTLLFYTNKGNARFLILDKNNELLDLVKENCHNLITREQFHAKFPNIKL